MKIMIMIALGLGVSSANAQKMKEADVPAAVKTTFVMQYPSIKAAKWEKEGANYEAEFELNKVETSALIDANGNLMEIETEIKIVELPKAVSEYVAKNLAGQKTTEASKIIDTKGVVTYEAEVGGTDYIFDSNGKFIKMPAKTK